jgi:hypothetical protein
MMSPKQRFPVLLEPGQLAALKLIEERSGAPVGAQIRLAIDAYLRQQTAVPKAEIRKLLAD